MKVQCNTCNHIIVSDTKRTVGCLCDSDSPTWVGVTSGDRLITMSYSKYQQVEE